MGHVTVDIPFPSISMPPRMSGTKHQLPHAGAVSMNRYGLAEQFPSSSPKMGLPGFSERGLSLTLAVLLMAAAQTRADAPYQVLRSFGVIPGLVGLGPSAPVIRGSDGDLYGTAYGDNGGAGAVVFVVRQDGSGCNVLHRFDRSGSDASNPRAPLIEGSDGALYGTSVYGGTNGGGTVFALNKTGQGYRILHSFGGNSGDGFCPHAPLLEGSDGMLYGTTGGGGTNGTGTVFRLNRDGSGYSVLRHCSADGNGGINPSAGLVEGCDGALYGVMPAGSETNGCLGSGTIFKLKEDGGDYTVLHGFPVGSASNDGQTPEGALAVGGDGAFYGVTVGGGTNQTGTVFKVMPDGTGYQVIYNFGKSPGDTRGPQALVGSLGGVLYGFAVQGGAYGAGALFRINEDGGGFEILYSFPVGATPSGLSGGTNGVFYGTTAQGCGTVFQVNTDGTGYAVLATLAGANGGDGSNPQAPLLEASDGMLYGTTPTPVSGADCGKVFKLSRDGAIYVILHSFALDAITDGRNPQAGLIEGRDGALYGTCRDGGDYGMGTVFCLSKDGSNYRVLLSFGRSPTDGQYPCGPVVEGRDGVLYGTTYGSAFGSRGSVYKLNKDGTGYALIHSFGDVDQDGSNPQAGLIFGSEGALYGTTQWGGFITFSDWGPGTVFKLNPDGSGYQVLHRFLRDSDDGMEPEGELLEGLDGSLYGTTSGGGIGSNLGTVFILNKDGGGYNILISFQATNACSPRSRLMQGRDGALYGTASYDSSPNAGAVFQLQPDGSNYRVLHRFASTGADSDNLLSGLVLASDGLFYGASKLSGALDLGLAYKLWPPQTPCMMDVSLAGATASVRFSGESGSYYQVLRSTNLAAWTVLDTVLMPSDGVFTYPDPEAPQPQSSYRAVWVP